jgi:hypothetical protein
VLVAVANRLANLHLRGRLAPWLILVQCWRHSRRISTLLSLKDSLCGAGAWCLVFNCSAWRACLKLRSLLSENVLSGRHLFVADIAFGLRAPLGCCAVCARSRCNVRQSVGVLGLMDLQDCCRTCVAISACVMSGTSIQRACCSTPWMLLRHAWVASAADEPSTADTPSSIVR